MNQQEFILTIVVNSVALVGAIFGWIKPQIEKYAEKRIDYELNEKIESYKGEIQKDLELYKGRLQKNMEAYKSVLQRDLARYQDNLSTTKKLRQEYYDKNAELIHNLTELRLLTFQAQHSDGNDKISAIEKMAKHLKDIEEFCHVHHSPFLRKWGQEINSLFSAFNELTNHSVAYSTQRNTSGKAEYLRQVNRDYENCTKLIEHVSELIFFEITGL